MMIGDLYKKWMTWLGATLIFCCYALFFLFYYPYHLFFVEQMQMFMLSSTHFLSYTIKPAFLSSWLGDFLVQFYYLQYFGPVLLSGVILLSGFVLKWFIARTKKEVSKPIYLYMVPSVFLIWLHLFLDYPLSFTISFIFGIIVAGLYTYISGLWLRRVIIILLIPILYWMLGYGMIIGASLVIIFEFTKTQKGGFSNVIFFLGLIAIVIATPLYLRVGMGLTIFEAWLYPAYSFGPSLFLLSLPLLVALAVILMNLIPVSELLARLVHIGSTYLILMLFLLGIRNYASFSVERILAVDSELYFGRVDKAAKFIEDHKQGVFAAYYHNLIRSKQGLLPEHLMDVSVAGSSGLFIRIDPSQNYVTITFSNEVYYHMGDVNASQHSALLGTIFSPKQQSSRLMKRLAEINIINGEYEVASKYLKMLSKTLFHRSWAMRRIPLLHNEILCNATPWVRNQRDLMPYTDVIRRTNDHETALKLLLETNPNNQRALDYILCYYLINKQVDSFAELLISIIDEKQSQFLPRIYQEALLIYYSVNPSLDIWNRVNIERAIMNNFTEYTALHNQHGEQGNVLQDGFGQTYWFFYHYARYVEN